MGWPKGRSRKAKPETAPETTAPQPEPSEKSRKKWTAKQTGSTPAEEKRRAWMADAKSRWGETELYDRSEENIFSLPEEVMSWLRDSELDAQWITLEVFGQTFQRHFNGFLKNGWTPLQSDLFPNLETQIGGSVLCVRPMYLSRRARKVEAEKARAPIQAREQMLGATGVPGVTGGDHPSALRHNKIRRSIEKVEIPRGD